MPIIFNLTQDAEGAQSVTAYVTETGQDYIAVDTHPRFDEIKAALLAGSQDVDHVTGLFDVGTALSKSFAKVSERVSIASGRVYFDGDPVSGDLADVIVDFYREQNDRLEPMVRFMEKVYQNPSAKSRDALYTWLRHRSFVINDEGNFLAYKSVWANDGGFHSVASGTAIVDGEVVEGHIPNQVGSVVEMPRSEVNDDTGIGCSTGLHAGTWDYANSFSGDTILTVEINPRDVVSVPTDCAAAKLRVCRYRVVEVVEKAHPTLFIDSWDDEHDEGSEFFDYDEDEDDDLMVEMGEEDEAQRILDLRSRDEIRRFARANGIVRGMRTKGQLAQAIADAGFTVDSPGW